MLHFLATILPLYVIARLILPLRLPLWLKLLLSLLVLLGALKLYLFRLAFGTMMPDMPRWAVIGTGMLHGALILLIILCAMRDALLLALWLARKFAPSVPALPFSTGQWALGLSALALLLSGLGVWQALRVPDVHHIIISLPRLPSALNGLRIVQLSDLHVSPAFPATWVGAVVRKVNALKPDLIVITGDLGDGAPARRVADLAPLKGLRAPLGVFSCTGNHEYYWGFESWMNASRRAGIIPLNNAHVILHPRGQDLVLAGVTDQTGPAFGFSGPNPRQALNGAPADAVRIMLAHRPRLIGKSAEENVDLQLSGHTHGGQVIGANRIVARFNDGFLFGLYHVGRSALYVSPGTGLWEGFPLRLFVPSEITEITLRRS